MHKQIEAMLLAYKKHMLTPLQTAECGCHPCLCGESQNPIFSCRKYPTKTTITTESKVLPKPQGR